MTMVYYEKLDIVKGFGIFLVVLGHCVQCGSGNDFYLKQLFFEDLLYRVIYSFHMPLFMIISGFLYGKFHRGNEPFIKSLIRRSMRLLLPIVIWNCLVGVISYMRVGVFNFDSIIYSIFNSFWFLWAVWWSTIVCLVIEKVVKNPKIQSALHITIAIFTFITPDNYNFSLYKFMYFCFMFGYVWAKLRLNSKLLISGNRKYYNWALLFAAYCLLFSMFDRESFIYISGWTLLGTQNWSVILVQDIYRIVVGVIGGGLVIYSTFLFSSTDTCHWLLDIGKNTIGIYILQTYISVIMLRKMSGIEHHVLLNVVESIIILFGSYIVVKIFSLIPFAGRLLFGIPHNEEKTT